MEKCDIHQKLMDEAYDFWKSKKGRCSYSQFLDEIHEKFSPAHYNAVILGNLNYQVENGGFAQWFDNGYSIALDDIKLFLTNYDGKTTTFNDVLQILEGVEDILKEHKKASRFQRYDTDQECYDDSYLDGLDLFDTKYYNINETFMLEVEAVLKKEYD